MHVIYAIYVFPGQSTTTINVGTYHRQLEEPDNGLIFGLSYFTTRQICQLFQLTLKGDYFDTLH